jgi:hypothetical protein
MSRQACWLNHGATAARVHRPYGQVSPSPTAAFSALLGAARHDPATYRPILDRHFMDSRRTGTPKANPKEIAAWSFAQANGDFVPDAAGHGYDAQIRMANRAGIASYLAEQSRH